MQRSIFRITLIAWLLSFVTGCSTVGYYHQSISGHVKLISKREPIANILNDPSRDEKLITQLQLAQALRTFASNTLKLPENDSYRSYVQLEEPYVTWNVFAAPPYSTDLKQWCFLVIGCVPYRGYFAEAKAHRYAEKLATQGLDVYVAGVPAYSTLGWFDDPLLSSMLDRGEIITASYIFHELAHQQFYLKGDGAFNEAFATAVEEIGVIHWLEHQNRSEEVKSYEDWLDQKSLFFKFVQQSRNEFEHLYQQEFDNEKMQVEKEILIAEMRRKFTDLSKRNKYIARYAKWMTGPLNNAQLGAIALYRELVPAFRKAFVLCEHSFEKFYTHVAKIADQPEPERLNQLLGPQACL